MPILHVHLMKGRNKEKKQRLVEELTKAVCHSLELVPENVTIILHEMEKEHYASSGILAVDRKP